MPAKATEIKPGMAVIYEGQLNIVLDTEHVKPGKGPAYVQTKMKNVKTGSITTKRLNSSDRLDTANIDRREMEFLYESSGKGEGPWVFMDLETYEQLEIAGGDALPDSQRQWLKPNLACIVEMYEGRPLGIQLPAAIELEVAETAPQPKGATVTNQSKEATLETGVVVRVPPFIENGQVIRVSPETGEYLGKA
ncbi:MAG: elongation factor P [Phycisphaerales bacterium]